MNENPFYPVVLEKIDALLKQKSAILVAIDGNCAAGKTTLTAFLQHHYTCNILCMDDFFLQPHQRTPERFLEPGGNIDYERFFQEVLVPLRKGDAFSYRPYDCHTQQFAPPVYVTPTALTIVEGVYSLHPLLISSYDLKILLQINALQQQERLQQRNPALFQHFLSEWIPLENRYFETFQLQSQCDLLLQFRN